MSSKGAKGKLNFIQQARQFSVALHSNDSHKSTVFVALFRETWVASSLDFRGGFGHPLPGFFDGNQ